MKLDLAYHATTIYQEKPLNGTRKDKDKEEKEGQG